MLLNAMVKKFFCLWENLSRFSDFSLFLERKKNFWKMAGENDDFARFLDQKLIFLLPKKPFSGPKLAIIFQQILRVSFKKNFLFLIYLGFKAFWGSPKEGGKGEIGLFLYHKQLSINFCNREKPFIASPTKDNNKLSGQKITYLPIFYSLIWALEIK